MTEVAIILWVVIAIASVLALWGHFIEPRRLRLSRRTVAIPDLPDALGGLTIALLSDFHCRQKPLSLRVAAQAVRMAMECDPDFIMVTGDLAHGSANMSRAIEVVKPLCARYGAFGVLGNHDFDWTLENLIRGIPIVGRSWPRWREAISSLGMVMLENETRVVEVNGCRVAVVGVGDACSGRDDVGLAMVGAGAPDLCLLLNHSPDILDDPRTDAADLVLCGHTHGGQWQIPGIGTLWAPVWRDIRRSSGPLVCGKTQCYVSRGVGSAMEMRINCAPEVVLITLQRGPAVGRRCRRFALGQYEADTTSGEIAPAPQA